MGWRLYGLHHEFGGMMNEQPTTLAQLIAEMEEDLKHVESPLLKTHIEQTIKDLKAKESKGEP